MHTEMKPILFKKKEDCCGCAACYSICPKKAINMLEDDEDLNIHILMKINVFDVFNVLGFVL